MNNRATAVTTSTKAGQTDAKSRIKHKQAHQGVSLANSAGGSKRSASMKPSKIG